MTILNLADAALRMQQDVHAALSQDVSVQTMLGDPVRAYDKAPETPIYPYLTYGNVRSEDTSGDGAPQSTHQMTLHVWSRYHGRSETLGLLRHVGSAIQDGVSHPVTSLYADVFLTPDGRTFHGLLRLSITLSEELQS